jgi:hypothetical protein
VSQRAHQQTEHLQTREHVVKGGYHDQTIRGVADVCEEMVFVRFEWKEKKKKKHREFTTSSRRKIQMRQN